jgi:DNA-directed RNA polymerase specialized sigma24 family protein
VFSVSGEQQAEMSRIEHMLNRRGIEISSSDDLRWWLMHAREGDRQAEQQLMRALMPLLIVFFTRRLQIERDELEELVRLTIERVRDGGDGYDPRKLFAEWLFGLARQAMLEHLDRRANRALHQRDASPGVTEYRVVILSRTAAAHSPHSRGRQ